MKLLVSYPLSLQRRAGLLALHETKPNRFHYFKFHNYISIIMPNNKLCLTRCIFSHWQLCTILPLVLIVRYSLWQKCFMKSDIRLKWLGQAENVMAHQQNASCALELFHSCMQISITHMRKLIHSTVNQKALKSSNTSLNHRPQLQLRWTNR